MSDLELTMMRRVGELNKEVARLKAEVERLTKAGDAMAELLFIEPGYIGSNKQEAVINWCKLTEGKPQP